MDEQVDSGMRMTGGEGRKEVFGWIFWRDSSQGARGRKVQLRVSLVPQPAAEGKLLKGSEAWGEEEGREKCGGRER